MPDAPEMISVPMNPISGVPQSVSWQAGKLPDGQTVAVVFIMSGCSTTKLEMSEEMSDQIIDGLRGIFAKPTLTIARTIEPAPNGNVPPSPFGPRPT